MPNACDKLNAAYAAGCFLIAAILGGITGSWTIFLLTLVISLAFTIQSGDIRPSRHR